MVNVFYELRVLPPPESLLETLYQMVFLRRQEIEISRTVLLAQATLGGMREIHQAHEAFLTAISPVYVAEKKKAVRRAKDVLMRLVERNEAYTIQPLLKRRKRAR